MDENLLKVIKNKLKSECYLMNDDWLRDCVDYYIKEHVNPSHKEILEFIKVQWQLSNLREINNENGSLPQHISKQKFMTLSGNYILQMEQMYDIATSKYKQLEQIRKIEYLDMETGDQEKQGSLEFPKKRMLQLKLTDGVQDVIAIEYNPLQLNDMLLPGYKVMIIGPVKCRKGVLLLEPGKCIGIGGEVDSLLIPNAVENVLARAVNLPENPDPYNDLKLNEIENREPQVFRLERTKDTEVKHENDDLKMRSEVNNPKDATQNRDVDILDDDDYLLEMKVIDPVRNAVSSVDNTQQLLSTTDFFKVNEEQFINREDRKSTFIAPFIALPNEDHVLDKDDRIIVINKEKNIQPKKCQDTCKKQEQMLKEEMKQTFDGNSQMSLVSVLDANALQKQKKITSSLVGNKRSADAVLSPVKTILKKGRSERKITEFIKKPSSLELSKICDFIRDVNNERITEITHRTIRGRVDTLGRLSKQDSSWILEATILDETGKIDVIFANEVLEKLLGFSVLEFSRKKKLKNNPEIENELRMGFRSAQQKLKTLDALLELELTSDKKLKVIKITDLTE